MIEFLKHYYKVIFLIFMTIIYFSYNITITWDSAHYLSLVELFENTNLFHSWDIVRGPSFPFLIFIFNTLIGKTMFSLQFMTFLFYLLYSYSVLQLLNIITKNISNRALVIFKYIVYLFCVFNPVIFGYFHTLLTEFVAISLSVFVILLSIKYIDLNILQFKCKSLFYFLTFIFLTIFLYFIKQPYVLFTLVPLFISTVFSIFRNKSMSNYFYRIIVFTSSLLFLFLSIKVWNSFLLYNDVDMNTGRDSNSVLSKSLIDSLSFADYTDIPKTDLLDSSYLTDIEKDFILNHNEYQVVAIYKNNNLVEYDLIVSNVDGVSSFDSLAYLIELFFKYPKSLLYNYFMNHCATSGLCIIESNDTVNYNVIDDINLFKLFENNIIAYRPYEYNSNIFYLSDHLSNITSNYHTFNDTGIYNFSFIYTQIPTNLIYTFVVLFSPIALLFFFVFYLFSRKIVFYNSSTIRNCCFLFLGTSNAVLAMNAVTSLIIDRYSVGVFIISLLGFVSLIIYIIASIKSFLFYKKLKETA